MKAERRTMAPGTARKPASRNRFSPQPSNFNGTLSHDDALPGPPGIALMSLRRNDSSTAFFSHWLTFHLPPASNFNGPLSHDDALPGPPGIALMSLRRNDSSTAFFSHWLTFHLPPAS